MTRKKYKTVVSHFNLQNTGTFRSDYTTGEKSRMQNKATTVLQRNNIHCPPMPLKTTGFGAEPQLYEKSVALKLVFYCDN